MLGDFLIESRCKAGHCSSAAFRRYTREHVEDVARALSDRCTEPLHATSAEHEECGERVAHVVSVLSTSLPTRPLPQRIATKPSMPAVHIVKDDDDGSTVPPPSTEDER